LIAHTAPRYGVILGWTGSPEAPEPEAVGRYLERFLMDPMVIRAPWLLRALLVRGLIVPRRKYRSAEAYRRIWTPLGSPLAAHTAALAEALEGKLGLPVLHGSAYGSPTLEDAARKAASLGDVPWLFMPLFPQYAGATRGTLETRFLQAAGTLACGYWASFRRSTTIRHTLMPSRKRYFLRWRPFSLITFCSVSMDYP